MDYKNAVITPKRLANQKKQKEKENNAHHPAPAPPRVRENRRNEIASLTTRMQELQMQEAEDVYRERRRAYYKELSREYPDLDWLIKDSLAELWARDPERTCESILQETPNPLEYFEHSHQEKAARQQQEQYLHRVAECTNLAFAADAANNPSPPPQPPQRLLVRTDKGNKPLELPIPEEIPGAVEEEEDKEGGEEWEFEDAIVRSDSLPGDLPVGSCHAERKEGPQDGQPQLHKQRSAPPKTISDSPLR